MLRIALLCLALVVFLSAYGSSSTGLTIVPRASGAAGAVDDEPNNRRTTRTVAVGGSATGNIEVSGDKDWFRVTLSGGKKYRFDLEGAAAADEAALSDPRLVFRDSSYTKLDVDTNGGTGKNARLERTVASNGGGTYYLVAIGQQESTGRYRLSVTLISNRAPEPAGRISIPSLREGDAAWRVDVSGNFTDPDGDTLSYTAESSNTDAADASVSGSTVTITPVAAGTAVITVTARDPGGLTAAQEISMTVNSSNRAPNLKGTIGDQTLALGSAPRRMDVSDKFIDPDGDTLSYTAESPDITIATASASGSTVTITPVATGAVTITVTAKDPGGLTAEQTFSVTISNQAPTPNGSVPAQMLTLGDDPETVDVSDKFSDPDGDTLSYAAESSNVRIAAASIMSGSTVTITPVAAGAATITVTAKDPGGLTAVQEISVTVRRPNRAPVANGSIGNQTMMLGDATWSLDISDKFSDPDGDTLTYTKEADSTVATVRISNRTVTVTPVATGTTSITVKAADPGGLSAKQTFSVTVLPQPNRKPRPEGEIATQLLMVGSAAGSFDVSDKFSDPDGDTLTYEAGSSNTAIVVASTLNSAVILTPVKGGTVTITVTARDPDGLSAEQTFKATVSNRPPVAIGEFDDRTLWVGDAGNIRAGRRFIDPDGDTLTYEASLVGANLATIRVSEGTVSYTIVDVGQATFRITAKDPGGGTATHEFLVTVPNRAPTPNGSISNRTSWIGETVQVNVSGKFSDPDRHALTYSAESSSPTVATVQAPSSTVTVTPVAVGSTTITVTARDPLGKTAKQSFSVTVPNRPPTRYSTIPNRMLNGTAPVTINVAGYFRDPDRHTLTYTPESSSTTVATVGVSGSRVTIRPVVKGAATITITARDPFGSTVKQSFSVTVPNRPPTRYSTIPNRTLNGTAPVTINAAGYFRDPDRHTLTYTPETSSTAVATVGVSGSRVTIRPVVKGTATITITARDPFGSTAKQTFSVTVPNRPPARYSTIPNRTLNGTAPVTINVAGYFRDPDRHALAYTPESSSTAIATVGVSGSVVTIRPVVKGRATITVTARDPFGSTAKQTFSVTVPNRPPVRNGIFNNQRLPIGYAETVTLSGKFSDPDRHALTYEANSSADTIATARISGNRLILTPVTRGTTTVTVTARDPFGGTATQRFSVTVPNRRPVPVGIIETQTLTIIGIPRFCYWGFCSGPSTTFSASVDVSGKFSDPDGDTLTYTATISGGSFTSAQNALVSGSTVSISRTSRFSGTVTVTARDPGGLTAVQTFAVKPPNRAPTPVGSIGNQSINRALRSTASVNVSGKFSDPDGDTLTYSARSSADTIATASASGNIVTIRAVGNGNATITVTATDPGNLKTTQTFSVGVFYYISRPTPPAPPEPCRQQGRDWITYCP